MHLAHCRFTVEEDKKWFDKCIQSVVHQHLNETLLDDMADEPYYVNFMRDAPEPTGEEDQDLETPIVYEMVSILSRAHISRMGHKLHTFVHI